VGNSSIHKWKAFQQATFDETRGCEVDAERYPQPNSYQSWTPAICGKKTSSNYHPENTFSIKVIMIIQ
jgi:hypothetical protein